eukprot:COSAG06_NODE_22861_length_710_cov_1.099836_2_plen_22_part_01
MTGVCFNEHSPDPNFMITYGMA